MMSTRGDAAFEEIQYLVARLKENVQMNNNIRAKTRAHINELFACFKTKPHNASRFKSFIKR